MKAHRFKSKLTSREDVEQEFGTELQRRIQSRIDAITPSGSGIIVAAQIYHDNREKFRIMEKFKLLKEWERKGRSVAFNKEFWMELCEKNSRYEAEEMVKKMFPDGIPKIN